MRLLGAERIEMGMWLDLADVAAGHPEAEKELAQLRADADLLDWLLGQAQATSLDMGGKHRWRFESAHRWPGATTMRASLEAYRAAMTPNDRTVGPDAGLSRQVPYE